MHYYVTERRQFPGNSEQRREALLDSIRRAVAAGADFIQLREKDLSPRALEELAVRVRQTLSEAEAGRRTKLLINSRMDVAIVAGADGVHLTANDVPASDARAILCAAGMTHPVVAVSCHSLEEVRAAESHGADFAVFGPVFGKQVEGTEVRASAGLRELERVCRRSEAAHPLMPVLAIGGVTRENIAACLQAGAAGIAAIRMFQQSDQPIETAPARCV